MSKTFREVIRDIKPYESYECDIRGVNTIRIDCNKVGVIKINSPFQCEIAPCYEFEKIKSKVPFEIAFKEYLNGKEIESCCDNVKYKYVNGACIMKTPLSQQWEQKESIFICEIADDWYIND